MGVKVPKTAADANPSVLDMANPENIVDHFDEIVDNAKSFMQLEMIFNATGDLKLVESRESLRAFKEKMQAPGDHLTIFPKENEYIDYSAIDDWCKQETPEQDCFETDW